MNNNNLDAVDLTDKISEKQKQDNRIRKYGKFYKGWLISEFFVYDDIDSAERRSCFPEAAI